MLTNQTRPIFFVHSTPFFLPVYPFSFHSLNREVSIYTTQNISTLEWMKGRFLWKEVSNIHPKYEQH